MNRCTPRTRGRLGALCICLSLAAALLCLAVPATAQQQAVRPFPAKAQRGAMQITSPPNLLMDGQPERLSPGARIRGPNNMLEMSGALVGHTLLVRYVREPLGLIHEVWVLNAAEVAAELATPPAPPATPAQP